MTPRLDMIGLVCRSIPESLRFYRLLGLDVNDQPGEDHVEATGPGGLRIAWDSQELIKQIDPDWKEPVGQRIGLAFLCESPSAVDTLFEKVKAEGFHGHKDPWDAFWGQRYAQVVDPDGNVVDLFAPLG